MRAWRIPAILMAVALVASACGDDPDVSAAGDATTSTTPPDATTSTSSTTLPVAAPGVEPIQLCDDVEIPTTDEIGNLSGFANIPSGITTASLSYTDQHPDTFAGRLIDRDHGGTFVFRFTDDPAPHEAALEALPIVAASDVVIDVVQVDYASSELEALQSEAGQPLFGRDDLQVVGMGSGNRYNRVTLTMIRPSLDHLATIAAEYPDRADMFCLEGPLWDESMAPPPIDEPFTVMADAGDDPLVTCSSSDPFPLSVLDGPPDVESDSDDPLHRVLLGSSFEGGQPTPQEGWRTLWRTDEAAEFYLLDETSFYLARFEFAAAGWIGHGHSSGGPPGCRLMLAIPDGIGIMALALDPANPPDPGSTTLHLLVNQRDCSSGASGVENMRPPEVIELDSEIRIAIAVVPPEGPQNCPSNERAPIQIELDEPIGDRAILDGLRVPPIEIE